MLVVCSPAGGPLDQPPEMSVLCAGCGGKIVDRYYLLAVDRRWHVQCLTCCQCKLQLDSELTCFARDGNIYCKEDYYRMFSVKRCTRCHLAISANELVMRVREHVYHLHCFTCATCNKTLTKGEYFGLKDDVIYCRSHYEMLMQYESPPNPYSHGAQPLKDETGKDDSSSCASSCGLSCSGNSRQFSVAYPRSGLPVRLSTAHKGRPRKQKGTQPSASANSGTPTPEVRATTVGSQRDTPNGLPQTPSACVSPSITDSNGNSMDHLPRPKRMRTSFKHHQLRTMKSYFAINHNPDAKDLKQLSQKTGLSKRVLQVWFQNARAKWRRSLLRQQTQGPEVVQDSKPLAELTTHPRFCDPLREASTLLDIQPTPITQEEQNIQTFTNLL